jgi:anti-sigma regulatory factor (Ser/Thr protein kinase)
MRSVSDLREPEPSLQLTLDARPEAMHLLRRQLHQWLREAGATGRDLFEVQLAVTEAFANAVEHPDEPTSHRVDVTGTFTDNCLTISVRDYGTWQSEETRKEQGGLGLLLIDALMDTVHVARVAGGTTVTMQRRLA